MRLSFCVLCGCDDPTALEHHHYIPVVQGGTDDENNIFTVCGTCHGRIHDIPRPHRLGELVRAGQEKERTFDELQDIAASKKRSANSAESRAKQAEQAEWREIERLQRIAQRPLPTLTPKAAPPPTTKVAPARPCGPQAGMPISIEREVIVDRQEQLTRKGNKFYRVNSKRVLATIEPSADWPNMYRVVFADGSVTGDVYNPTRASQIAMRGALAQLNGSTIVFPPRRDRQPLSGAIRAELTGSDTCSALGVVVKSPTPVIELCRRLITAGHAPKTPMEVYRNDTLALIVSSIGEVAKPSRERSR